MSNFSPLPAPSRARTGAMFAAALSAATAVSAQTTWLENPADNIWNNPANWSTGTTPTSTNGAVFGYSTVNGININTRLAGPSLTFTSAATAPYQLTFANTGTSHVITGIFNDSPWAPTLIFQDGADLRLSAGTALDDAHLIFSSGGNFVFLGLGATATIQMNGGSLFYGRGADGENARLILGGGSLLPSNAADDTIIRFGSIEGSGTIGFSVNGGLVVGSNHRDAAFSGSIESDNTTPHFITKTGTGTWTLATVNTSNAAFTVEDGALAIDTDARLGLGGTLTLNGGALRATASFNDLRALVIGSSGGALDTQSFNLAQTGGLSGSGTFTKLGTGTLTLAAAGTLAGDVLLAAGTLALGHDSALGTGTLQLDGGALAASGAPRTVANALRLNADTTLSGAHALTLAGPLTLARNREFTVANTAPTTISGPIGETGGPRAFARYGSGELILTGASTYTGGTLLAEGLTRINNLTGSAFGTGAVTVASGATLTGAGAFTGSLQNNGTYAPGNSPALVTLSEFSQGPTGVLQMELGGLLRGAEYDALDITGAAAFDGTLSVSLINGYSPAAGASFNLFDWGSIGGTFAVLDLADLSGLGLAWDTSALYTSGVLAVTAIPEPSTFAALAGLAALALVVARRRRRS